MNKKRIIKPLLLLSVLCLFLTTSCENLLTDTSAEDVAAAKTALSIQFADKDSESSVTKNIVLPISADKEVVISWTSDNTAVSSIGKVTRPSAGSDDVAVVLTATLTKNKASDTKKFTLTVKAFPDTTAPQEVTDLTGEAGNAQAVLSWTNPLDSDFEGVKITADGIEAITITKDKTSETITGLTNGTEYTFTVKTYDTAGNISKGKTVKLTPLLPDTTDVPDATTEPDIELTGTIISTAVELASITDLTKNYTLANDIDMSTLSTSFTPLGNRNNKYEGIFNGNGKKITNLAITENLEYSGIFAFLGEKGVIHDLNLVDVSIISERISGTLVGESIGEIRNITVTGSITGKGTTGGLVGQILGGSISDCTLDVLVDSNGTAVGGLAGFVRNCIIKNCKTGNTIQSTNSYVGGLIGTLQRSTVENCISTSIIKGSSFVGGLIGDVGSSCTILNSSASGNVEALFSSAGGLIGSAESRLEITLFIENTTASGSVKVKFGNAGGLIGTLRYGQILNSQASGNVIGSTHSGGLVGVLTSSVVKDSHSTGSVSSGEITEVYSYIGGLLGETTYTEINKCYATGEVSATGSAVGGLIGSGSLINVIDSYSTGNVLSTGIYSVGGFIGSSSGSITNCSTSSNVTAENAEWVGGFSGSSGGQLISDCFATGNVIGKKQVGGFTGGNTTTKIEKSFAKGAVKGESYVGGFVGRNVNKITECFALNNVEGIEYTGGFAGWNHKEIINSFARGVVKGFTYTGGFVGYHQNDVDISKCYSSSDVTGSNDTGPFVGYLTGLRTPVQVYDCYYSHTDGYLQANNTKYGYQLLTHEMKTRAKYSNWDFETIWDQSSDVNEGFPYLRNISIIE